MRTFVGKMMSLLFNSLSRFAIVFLPRSKCLLISWLPSLSTVILEPKKTKSSIVSAFSSSICHEVVELDVMILVLWMLSFKPAFSLSSFTLNSPFCSLVSLHLCWSYFVSFFRARKWKTGISDISRQERHSNVSVSPCAGILFKILLNPSKNGAKSSLEILTLIAIKGKGKVTIKDQMFMSSQIHILES